MTNWTDLIDTDPVGAAKACMEDIDRPRSNYDRDVTRLMSNLAALAEALTDVAMRLQHAPDHECTRSEYIAALMKSMRNPDGSPRFPVKEQT